MDTYIRGTIRFRESTVDPVTEVEILARNEQDYKTKLSKIQKLHGLQDTSGENSGMEGPFKNFPRLNKVSKKLHDDTMLCMIADGYLSDDAKTFNEKIINFCVNMENENFGKVTQVILSLTPEERAEWIPKWAKEILKEDGKFDMFNKPKTSNSPKTGGGMNYPGENPPSPFVSQYE